MKITKAVKRSFRMSTQPETVSNADMEKRIELEKRGGKSDEVCWCLHVKWAVSCAVGFTTVRRFLSICYFGLADSADVYKSELLVGSLRRVTTSVSRMLISFI